MLYTFTFLLYTVAMAEINDKTLDKLYTLARIEPEKDAVKREKLIADLGAILNHFKELKEVDTSDTEPLAGGSFLASISREDDDSYEIRKKYPRYAGGFGEASESTKKEDLLIGQFPESENGYLKTPPVF